VHNKVFGTKDVQVDNFNDVDKIMDYYKDKDPISQTNAFNSLFIITENKKYQTAMMESKEKTNAHEHKQEMNEKQRERVKINPPMLGKNLSQEAKNKISLANKGKKRSPEFIERMREQLIKNLNSKKHESITN
jgi:hypothetical protein